MDGNVAFPKPVCSGASLGWVPGARPHKSNFIVRLIGGRYAPIATKFRNATKCDVPRDDFGRDYSITSSARSRDSVRQIASAAFNIDDELELGWLLERNTSWLSAFEQANDPGRRQCNTPHAARARLTKKKHSSTI